ncbi:aminopeptidase N [Hyalella azteca]|uniref:Aminopeptidase n=1 Tax=Hyalella azteca TaxID=294128 RepID=A0A8B7P143_HYAAZ|nr:aminopeptidase N [Hyalella azteca]XP_018019815.1 aminopeptidase N [Hyalella azteca]
MAYKTGFVALALLIFFQAKECDCASNAGASLEATNVRLPTSLSPVSYVLRLQPLINGNFTILGYVEIVFGVIEATNNITLHIKDIITKNDTIQLYSGDKPNGQPIAIVEHSYDADRDFYTATLAEPLTAGRQYLLLMEYEGYLNDQLVGFYRSQYKRDDGSEVWAAVTQFQPTDARRAFPCFDEPAFKATFDISIARQTNMTAISNMPLVDTTPFADDEEWVWDHFAPSLPMSTYLVAFIVSDYASVNSTYNDHVLFKVWARKEAIDQTWYAIAAGPAILTWYEEYFSIPFPLPKQDMAALLDFSLGGMENWGLITYRETALLMDPELNSASDRERVATVVAHELAHQWFGDLVTMEWWSDLWLNEGFASYVEYLGTDFYEPDWKYLDTFVKSDVQYAFVLDSLESSHPISVAVESPNDINQIFDSISYSKGASIIRMMNNFLTESTFRSGITNYLNLNKYGNAAQDDLWEALTEQAHADGTLPQDLTVKTIMDTWTLQMGYPVVNAYRSGQGTVILSQKRFLLVKSPNSTDTHDYKWWVPVSYTTQSSPDFSQTQPTYWIPNTEESITIDGIPDGQWVVFNLQETGYYRVNYDSNNWQLLVDQLTSNLSVINLVSRAQLIDDSMDLARAGQLQYDIALDLNSYLIKESEFVPWDVALDNLEYLEQMFTRRGGYGQLKHYLTDLLEPLYNSVGFEDNTNDPQLEQKKRVLAVDWACHLGYGDCVMRSVQLYSQWMASPDDQTLISANLRSTVYCTAIAHGGEAEWNFAWEQYLATNVAREEERIRYALSCSREVWILSKYLDMAFTEGSGIRKQDAGRVFENIASNDIGRDIAWEYLQNNVEHIAGYLQTFSVVGDMVAAVSNEFNTELELQELISFKNVHVDELASATYAIDQSIENTSNNIAWMDSYYDYIVNWLTGNGYPLML